MPPGDHGQPVLPLLEDSVELRFIPMVAESLFTDGWLMSHGHYETPKALHRFLRSHELDVVMPIVVPVSYTHLTLPTNREV